LAGTIGEISMTFSLRPATRASSKPLIGLHSESGAGKTYSALLLARGFCGKPGRIIMIETESGRGEAYSNPTEYPELAGNGDSNYDVISMRDSFSAQDYGEAIKLAETEKADVLIIDSASHEWEGVGGVLDQAAQNQANGKKGVIVWQQPKINHQKYFMLKFMQTSIPLVILCMRSKYPMKQVVVNGRKDWARSETLDPKQSDDILFEMFVHGWIDSAHNFHPGKITAKGLEPVFADGKPIGLDTGKALAAWSSAVPKVEVEKTPEPTPDSPSLGEAPTETTGVMTIPVQPIFRVVLAKGADKMFEDGVKWADFITSSMMKVDDHTKVQAFLDRNLGAINEARTLDPDQSDRVIESLDERLNMLKPDEAEALV
jgi:hypothetical protein